MTQEQIDHPLLSDEEFETLEELLVSDVVPEDCMDLEMLDGFLAALIASPQPLPPAGWLPAVWSAHGDEVSFSAGRQMQQVIHLVLRYHDELRVTLGADHEDRWEPFCYATGEGDTLAIGEEWMAGFSQGLELWPTDWENLVPAEAAAAVRDEIARMAATWGSPGAQSADEETRLLWLEEAGQAVERIHARWRAAGLPEAAAAAVAMPPAQRGSAPGRNDPCPCGSGKKYKKCCGAAQA